MEKSLKWSVIDIVVMAVWGSFFLFINKLGEDFPIILQTFLRFVVVFILILPLLMRRNLSVKEIKKDWLVFLFLGIVGTVLGTVFMIMGLFASNTVVAATLTNFNPVIVLLLTPLFLKEKVGGKKILGGLIAFLGVSMIILNGQNPLSFVRSEYFVGCLYLLLSALCFAVHTLFLKKYVDKYGGLKGVFYTIMFGVGILFFLAIPEFSYLANVTFEEWIYLVILGIATGFVLFVWGKSFQYIETHKAASFKILIPVFAGIYSVIFLQEALTDWIWLGVILVISGLWLVEAKDSDWTSL